MQFDPFVTLSFSIKKSILKPETGPILESTWSRDVVEPTAMGRNDVASTSMRRHVLAETEFEIFSHCP